MNYKAPTNLILTNLALALSLVLVGCTDADTTKKTDNQSANTSENVAEQQKGEQKDVVAIQSPKVQPPQGLYAQQAHINSNANTKAKPQHQTCAEVDKQVASNLVTSFENSNYNISSTMERAIGSKVDNANMAVKQLLTEYAQQADSMQCDFTESKEQGLMILNSDDNKFRVYSWDINTGGTMHNYAGFYQFINSDGNMQTQGMRLGSVDEPLHQFPNALFTANLDGEMGEQIYYLLASTGVYSTMDKSQSLQVLAIENKKVIHPEIIKTSTLTSSLGFAYDFFSVANRPERPIQLFEYDDKSKIIRFPVVVEDPEFPSGKVTDKKIKYRFDGQYFQRVKN